MLIGKKTCRCNYKDCPKGALTLKLCIALSELVELLPQHYDITITSGFRCHKHNRDSHGSKSSYHMLGMAADIFCKDLDVTGLLEVVLQIDAFARGGIGIYLNDDGHEFLHLDVRDYKKRFAYLNGEKIDWNF